MYSQYVFIGVPLQLHTARIACWFSKATTHWSNFCTRDGIDSQTVLWTIRESKMEKMKEHPSKSKVIGSFIGMGMVDFCFGIGLMLAVKTVNNLECCISRKCL